MFMLFVVLFVPALSAPLDVKSVSPPLPAPEELDKRLDSVLDWFFEQYVRPKGAEMGGTDTEGMQADQPAESDNDVGGVQFANLDPFLLNLTHFRQEDHNISETDYVHLMRNRTKDTWIQMIKENILRQVGRVNSTMPKTGQEFEISALNISQFMPGFHQHNHSFAGEDEFVTEKIRSYYPSCEIPRNTDQEVWKDENAMNLYFNIDYSEENGVNIATATLRLYRVFLENATANSADSSCENSSSEEDKLIRISTYWYTRSLKKHRVKRRLSDSKVVGESAKWVELSVRPATKAWTKGRNLGLAVLVEDQDGTVLKADKYFKGASCMVGASTPKPIPTVIIDAAWRANGLDGSHGNSGGDPATTFHHHISLLPTIDICTLEFPSNSSGVQGILGAHQSSCSLDKLHQEIEMQRTPLAVSRHIRHQRQHLQEAATATDPRSRMIGQKVVLTSEQVRRYNEDLRANGTDDDVNR